jgi:hypothetical protein
MQDGMTAGSRAGLLQRAGVRLRSLRASAAADSGAGAGPHRSRAPQQRGADAAVARYRRSMRSTTDSGTWSAAPR